MTARFIAGPAMPGSGRQQVWGSSHAVAFALTGVGAGAYLLAALGAVGTAQEPVKALGLVTTAVGALGLLSEVKHRRPLLRYLPLRLASSWMGRGVTAMSLFLLTGAGGLAIAYLAPGPTGLAKSLSLLAALCALVVMVYQGFVLASSSVALWKTRLTPLEFLAGNMSGGIALVILYYAATGNVGALPPALRPALVIFVVGHLMLVLAHLRFAAPEVRAYALRLLAAGSLAPLFWGGAIMSGVVMPGVMVGATYYVTDGVTIALLFLSSLLVVTGLVAHRYCLLGAGVTPGVPHEVLVDIFSPICRRAGPGSWGTGPTAGQFP